MHGHTGFLVTARRLAPGVVPPERTRRPAKGAYGASEGKGDRPANGFDESVGLDEENAPSQVPGSTPSTEIPAEAWTPEALGERVKSDKRIRRLRRSVTERSDEL
jgi:tRNA (adenine57-N1/adenine58-N1)-methyltransferase